MRIALLNFDPVTMAIFSCSSQLEIAAQEKLAAEQANEGGIDQVITDAQTPGLWVTGDSVILGIRNVLAKYERIELINARVGRQIGELIEVTRTDQQFVGDSPVVLNLGNNNRLVEAEIVELMEIVKAQPKIIVVNTAVPRSWKDLNNQLIGRSLLKCGNVSDRDSVMKRFRKKLPKTIAKDWKS